MNRTSRISTKASTSNTSRASSVCAYHRSIVPNKCGHQPDETGEAAGAHENLGLEGVDRQKTAPGRDPMPAKQTITSIKALRGKEIAKGVTIKPLAGEHVMLNYVQFVPQGEVPLHSHHHEQLGLIIEG